MFIADPLLAPLFKQLSIILLAGKLIVRVMLFQTKSNRYPADIFAFGTLYKYAAFCPFFNVHHPFFTYRTINRCNSCICLISIYHNNPLPNSPEYQEKYPFYSDVDNYSMFQAIPLVVIGCSALRVIHRKTLLFYKTNDSVLCYQTG